MRIRRDARLSEQSSRSNTSLKTVYICNSLTRFLPTRDSIALPDADSYSLFGGDTQAARRALWQYLFELGSWAVRRGQSRLSLDQRGAMISAGTSARNICRAGRWAPGFCRVKGRCSGAGSWLAGASVLSNSSPSSTRPQKSGNRLPYISFPSSCSPSQAPPSKSRKESKKFPPFSWHCRDARLSKLLSVDTPH